MILFLGLLALGLAGCAGGPRPLATEPVVAEQGAERDFRAFLRRFSVEAARREEAFQESYWQAVVEGDAKAWERLPALELALRRLYTDQGLGKELDRWVAEDGIRDALLVRQRDLLRHGRLENRLDEDTLRGLVQKTWALARAYHAHVFSFQGRDTDEARLVDLLDLENPERLRRRAYDTLLSRGKKLAPMMLALVRARNRAARTLGYTDFYDMQLRLSETDPKALQDMLTRLQAGTDSAWAEVKGALDRRLELKGGEARPWQVGDPFLRELPPAAEEDPDALLAGIAIGDKLPLFFRSLGLDVEPALRAGGGQSASAAPALCLAVDRAADVRLSLGALRGADGLQTALHELGHGAYALSIDRALPWLLRQAAHPALSEGVAMLFARLRWAPAWLQVWLQGPAEAVEQARGWLPAQGRVSRLAFMRWALVLVGFERELYRDPEQDLDGLWRRLRAELQGVAVEEGAGAGEWAGLFHLASAPVYFQNYVFGEVLAGCLEEALRRAVPLADQPWFLQPAAGRWLKEKIFAPGARRSLDGLLQHALGEDPGTEAWLRAYARPATRR